MIIQVRAAGKWMSSVFLQHCFTTFSSGFVLILFLIILSLWWGAQVFSYLAILVPYNFYIVCVFVCVVCQVIYIIYYIIYNTYLYLYLSFIYMYIYILNKSHERWTAEPWGERERRNSRERTVMHWFRKRGEDINSKER